LVELCYQDFIGHSYTHQITIRLPRTSKQDIIPKTALVAVATLQETIKDCLEARIGIVPPPPASTFAGTKFDATLEKDSSAMPRVNRS